MFSQKFLSKQDHDFIKYELKASPTHIMDTLISVLTKQYVIDVIKLDDHYTKKLGYRMDKHGSMLQFTLSYFGEEKSYIILRLLATEKYLPIKS